MSGGWYDRQGKPIDIASFEPLAADMRYKIVRQTHTSGKWVSTVWLGLDHRSGTGPPLIFETMIFGDTWLEEFCERYATEAAALAGHDRAVASLGGAAVECGPDCADPSHDARRKDRADTLGKLGLTGLIP